MARRRFDPLDDLGQPQFSVGGDGGVEQRHLQNRDPHGALADGGIEGVPDGEALVLLVRGVAVLVPFLGGKEARLLAVQPESGGRAQPEIRGVLRHAVHHAGPAAQVVEEDVAALHDGVVQVHRLVRLGATEAAAADLDVAATLDLVLGHDDLFL